MELKMSSRGLVAPGTKKVKIRVEKRVKKWKFQLFLNFFDSFSTLIFLTFWDPRARRAPGTHFQVRFQLWARRVQELLWGDGRVAMIGTQIFTRAFRRFCRGDPTPQGPNLDYVQALRKQKGT